MRPGKSETSALLLALWLPCTLGLTLLTELSWAAGKVKTPASSAAAPAFSPALNSASFILEASAKDVALLRDGIIAEAPPGKALAAQAGLNEILLTAPGHGIRKLRFWLKPGEVRTLKVELSKLLNPLEPTWESEDKVLSSSRIAALPSICVWYRQKTPDQELCTRQTLLEDLAFSEPSLFHLEDLQTLALRKELHSYRILVNRVFEPEQTEKVEDFYNRHGGLIAVKQLAALHNFLQGDCPRVHSIYVEAQQVIPNSASLLLYKALCAEIRAQAPGLQEELKTNKAPPPSLYYHHGRQLLLKAPAKALELAARCLKIYRFDLACQELGLMAARVAKQEYKVQKFSIEEGAFRTLLKLETHIPKGRFEAAFFSILPLINSYPQSMESYIYLAWLAAAEKLPGGSGYLDRKIAVTALLTGPTLEKIIETLEKTELARLLIPVYQRKLRLNANDPNTWVRLIRAYAKAEQCEAALATIQQGAHILPKYSASLLQIQAACLIEANRLSEALEVYAKVQELKPQAWSSPYNLAAVYERMKKSQEAIQLYKQALELQPPAESRDHIQFKLLELQTPESETSDERAQ